MHLKLLLAALVAGAGSLAAAQTFPVAINTCPPNHLPTVVNIQTRVSTILGSCPLLEEPALRSLVDKFAYGTIFAHSPTRPGTCLSGTVIGGTLTQAGQPPIEVRGRTESAQREFAEARALGDPVFITSPSGISGAAITVVTLTRPDSTYLFDVVLSDRFTVDYTVSPPHNTEDMQVIGASAKLSVLGHVVATAAMTNPPGYPMTDAVFDVSGTLCMR